MRPQKDIEKQPLVAHQQPSLLDVKELGSRTVLIILYYAFCSSLMLVINKLAIHHVPAPAFILCCQLGVSVAAVLVGSAAGWLVADKLEWDKLLKFVWVVIGFLGTLVANIKVLQNANVETFITFRSSTPLVLSVCDYLWLGRAFPNARSWACLVVLLLGSAGYVLVDANFKLTAYFWLILWYGFFTFDTVYVKHMCDTVKMTNWGRVYYTNFLAFVPLFMALPFLNEPGVLMNLEWSFGAIATLTTSCVLGVAMSHASYLLREAVSATLFTIVGIICKVVTVIINIMIWDKHASPTGIAFLLVCVFAGTFYEQAPKRNKQQQPQQQEAIPLVARTNAAS
ncbi:hypothetical protein VOLCADRAFT_80147 [Volvox carteri f. nagariensis]|uniref:Sugar phosphate transporter domain-containing protein n=1 Tax=Volvox carteri f. nagariensis TaxID=3068 RepID=D8TPJ0_VOLCA|nr:uncharacterized protein VOLCADRAFT_80147 [Volvox carteri f. nagariensis]EFJ50624.1 hypothetical protein VOLCADRAFT_80147 [Volvox carteri f. nagariensis]|eukprot:XP_002948217.1 hypothetical protein VOLCADRAFT_80147 [Volvox carteri f. nagariensis]